SFDLDRRLSSRLVGRAHDDDQAAALGDRLGLHNLADHPTAFTLMDIVPRDSEPAIVPRDDQSLSRKARTSVTVAFGFSSMIQCPEPGITPSSTSLAAKRITAAMVVPNDFSPPSARTGTLNLPAARKPL